MSNTGKSLMPFFQPLVNGGRQSLFTQFDTMRTGSDERARPPRLLQTESQIVNALRHAPDPGFRNNEPAASNLRRKKVSQRAETVLDEGVEPSLQLPDAIRNFRFRFDHDFRRG